MRPSLREGAASNFPVEHAPRACSVPVTTLAPRSLDVPRAMFHCSMFPLASRKREVSFRESTPHSERKPPPFRPSVDARTR